MPETAKQRLISSIRKKALRAAKASGEARSQLEEVADALVDDEQEAEEERPKTPRSVPEDEQVEESDVDPESVPYKDWLNLASVAGVPVSSLKLRRGLDPYNCTIAVERVKPSMFRGKSVPTGLIPGCRFSFPFNLTQIEQEIASLYGGEQYNLRLRTNFGKTLRTIPLTIAMPPKNISEAEEQRDSGDGDDEHNNGGRGPVSELRQKVREEELTTELLRRRRQRLEAQQEVEELEPSEEAEAEPAPSEFDINQEVERRVQTAREELVQEYEVKAELKSLREEIRNSRRGEEGGGGMSAVLASMQSQTNVMLEGLKMVVTNVADQMKDMQRGNQSQLENILKIQTVSQDAQARVQQTLFDAKKGELELVMKLVGDKREREDMTIDRITNLIMTGMELKAGMAGKESGGDDWLNVAIKSLTDLITKKTLADTSIPALPAPSGAPSVDAEEQRRIIEVEAQKAAAKIVAKTRRDALARAAAKAAAAPVAPVAPAVAPTGAAPAQPAPAASVPVASGPAGDTVEVPEEDEDEDGDTLEVEESPLSSDPVARRRALMSQVLAVVLTEMDDMPLESQCIDFALTSMPADWRQKIAVTDNALELAEFFKPFADLSLIEQIKTKAKSTPAQKDWLIRQAGILRGAVVEALQEEKQGGAS